MIVDALADFVAIGGYARYVWGSYGLFAIVMVANVVVQLRRARRIRARLERELRFGGPVS